MAMLRHTPVHCTCRIVHRRAVRGLEVQLPGVQATDANGIAGGLKGATVEAPAAEPGAGVVEVRWAFANMQPVAIRAAAAAREIARRFSIVPPMA